MAWPDSVSGWCFWASAVVVTGVSVVLAVTVMLGPVLGEGDWERLMRVMLFGLAAGGGVFLLGVVCALVASIRGEREGGWRL